MSQRTEYGNSTYSRAVCGKIYICHKTFNFRNILIKRHMYSFLCIIRPLQSKNKKKIFEKIFRVETTFGRLAISMRWPTNGEKQGGLKISANVLQMKNVLGTIF